MSKLIFLNLSACHICCIYGLHCSVAPFDDNFYPSNPSFPLLTLRCSVALFNDNFFIPWQTLMQTSMTSVQLPLHCNNVMILPSKSPFVVRSIISDDLILKGKVMTNDFFCRKQSRRPALRRWGWSVIGAYYQFSSYRRNCPTLGK